MGCRDQQKLGHRGRRGQRRVNAPAAAGSRNQLFLTKQFVEITNAVSQTRRSPFGLIIRSFSTTGSPCPSPTAWTPPALFPLRMEQPAESVSAILRQTAGCGNIVASDTLRSTNTATRQRLTTTTHQQRRQAARKLVAVTFWLQRPPKVPGIGGIHGLFTEE